MSTDTDVMVDPIHDYSHDNFGEEAKISSHFVSSLDSELSLALDDILTRGIFPLCCTDVSLSYMQAKITRLDEQFKKEVLILLQDGFHRFTAKDLLSMSVLRYLLGVSTEVLRDDELRKLQFDFRNPSTWEKYLVHHQRLYSLWREKDFNRIHWSLLQLFFAKIIGEAELILPPDIVLGNKRFERTVNELGEGILNHRYGHLQKVELDSSAISEVLVALQLGKVIALLLYVTHNLDFEECVQIVQDSLSVPSAGGSRSVSFDLFLSVDRTRLGCWEAGDKSEFLMLFGETKGVTEATKKAWKGSTELVSRDRYQEYSPGKKPEGRYLIGADFLRKVSNMRFHLLDRYAWGWELNRVTTLYGEVVQEYQKVVGITRCMMGRENFVKEVKSSHLNFSPFMRFRLEDDVLVSIEKIKAQNIVEYGDAFKRHLILPNPKRAGSEEFAVYHPNMPFVGKACDPYNNSENEVIIDAYEEIRQPMVKRMVSYVGTCQNGSVESSMCGFTGIVGTRSEPFNAMFYMTETILNCKNYGKNWKQARKEVKENDEMDLEEVLNKHLKEYTSKYELQFDPQRVVGVVWGGTSGKFVDPELSIARGIIGHYRRQYDVDTKEAHNFRRSRRTNWSAKIKRLLKEGEVEEARRNECFANVVLHTMHEYLVTNNTKMRRYKQIKLSM